MERRIAWVVMLKAKDEGSARKLLSRIQERLGCDMHLGEIARYWKDESLYRCEFELPLPADVVGVADGALAHATTLAPSWEVMNVVDGGLSGVASSGFTVAGVTWASFDVRP
jgi:hypothetical protein